MSEDEVKSLHDKIDALTVLLQESREQRAVMTTEMRQMCKCLSDLNEAVMGPEGIRARLTKVEGKVSVGQWLLMTLGTALIGCLVAGIWAIAVKV